MFGAGFIGSGLQCAEQEIQSAGAIGADLGKLARRFRQLLLSLRRGNDPGVVLGKSDHRDGRHDCGEDHDPAVTGAWESQSHGASLDAQNRAAKRHVVKDL
jgi:hypothetical protein